MTTKSIMYSNYEGTFFHNKFLQRLKHKKVYEIMEILQTQNVDPYNLSDSSGTTLLHIAAKYGNREFVKFLIDSGYQIDAQNRLNETPLMFAVEAGEYKTVELLLQFNANMFMPNINGRCSLGIALDNKFDDWNIALSLLERVTVHSLKHNKHVKSQKFHSDCPLYNFISFRNIEVTRMLLEKGSLVNAKSLISGKTALHVAVEQLNLETIEILLEFNANVNARSNERLTPLAGIWNWSDQNKVLKLLNILMAAGAILIDYSSKIIMAKSLLINGILEIVRTVLQNSLDVKFEDENGMTTLHYLAQNRHPDILEELEGFEFDINVHCQHYKRTMLHYAIKVGNISSVRFLLDRGSEVNTRDNTDCTPLSDAVYRICCLDSIELLLEYDADCEIFIEDNISLDLDLRVSFPDMLMQLINPILAQLAIVSTSAQGITQSVKSKIELFPQLKSNFDAYKVQLEELKPINVGISLTLYDLLISSNEKTSLCARSNRIVLDVTNFIKDISLLPYYYCRLQKRLKLFSELVKIRVTAATILHEILQDYWNISVHNVAEKILSYVQDQDLRRMI